jgi:LemA protein
MSWIIIAILIVIALGLIFWVVGIYNHLVRLRNQVKNAWSQIDVQLQRRYDLIPNLVETVKGYMTYERETLESVIKARNQAQTARETLEKQGGPTGEGASLKELMGAEATLRGSLGNIFALAENYPQLRATENMQRLQEELASTENKVAFSRQSYNDTVLLYNNTQQQIPASFFAPIFGHRPADLFEVQEEEAKKAVKVQF